MNHRYLKLLFFLLTAPVFCYANAGVPMIVLLYPSFIILLLPIIAIEYFIIKSIIAMRKKRILSTTIVSNLASTLIGIPLAWGFLFLIELLSTGGSAVKAAGILHLIGSVTLQAAWLMPYEKHLYWMIPTATMINLIPAYFVSKYSEYFIAKKFMKEIDKNQIKKAVFKANNVTYLGLFLLSLAYLIFNLITES
jgi:hypothetical protein